MSASEDPGLHVAGTVEADAPPGAGAAHGSRQSARFEQRLGIDDAPAPIEQDEGAVGPAGAAPAIICRPGTAEPQWLTAPECRVLARPGRTAGAEPFATFHGTSGNELACLDHADGRVDLPFSPSEAYESFVLEPWGARQAEVRYTFSRNATQPRTTSDSAGATLLGGVIRRSPPRVCEWIGSALYGFAA